MALVVNENTYVDITDADEYFATRYNSPLWSPLTTEEKEAALITATRALDNYCTWIGEPYDEDQLLAHPRYPEDTVPQLIIVAELEIAYSIVSSNSPTNQLSQFLKEMKVDVLNFKFGDGVKVQTLFNDLTVSILRNYCAANQSQLVRC